jgi:cellulose synthase/poly-beta-1,6-N-acetylglucosamine synthase-like glycosyltransferase
MVWTILFFLGISAVLYTYLGYPLILFLLTLWRRREGWPGFQELPRVTHVVAAFNEEMIMRRKIESLLELDYPRDLIEILVVSDASDDRTDSIVRSFDDPSVTLVSLPERSGKTVAQNVAIDKVGSEIVVFSDANSMLGSTSLKELIEPLSDPKVGCVAGALDYVSINSRKGFTGAGESIYTRYERLVRRLESKFGRLVGADGGLYALRRSLYENLAGNIISDLTEPLRIADKGFRTVFAPNATYSEEIPSKGSRELFMRRVRIFSRAVFALWSNRSLLNPFHNFPMTWQIVSHKLFRWLLFLPLLLLLISNIFLLGESPVFTVVFVLQCIYYVFAAIGLGLEGKEFPLRRLFTLPASFFVVNLACAVAFYKFIKGDRYVYWKPRGG